MARHGTTHWDVAAYALGVLDPRDVLRCEAHLAECESCAAELETLLPATKLLADVDLESLREAEESQLADRLMESVRVERHRSRRRQRILAAVGTGVAATVTGVALLAGATFLAPTTTGNVANDPPVTASPSPVEPPGVGGPDLGEGDEFSATDPNSGAQAQVLVAATDWGTQVAFTLSSVTGPLECQLQVVGADGSIEVIGSWRVPPKGYGTAEQPDPLLVQAPTATYRGEIAQLRVLATAPNGDVTTLVAVPV